MLQQGYFCRKAVHKLVYVSAKTSYQDPSTWFAALRILGANSLSAAPNAEGRA